MTTPDGEQCPCGRTDDLIWSPLWSEYLCASCLWQRVNRELDEPVTILPVEP